MGFNLPKDFIVPEVEKTQPLMNEETANEEAIYTIGLDGSADFEDIFKMSEDLKNGITEDRDLKDAKIQQTEANNYKSAVADIIDDPQYDDLTKRQLIADYYKGVLEPQDKEDVFVENISTLPGGDFDVEDQNQDAHLSTIIDSRAEKKDYQSLQEDQQLTGNVIDFFNNSEIEFGPSIPKNKNGSINWKQWGKQTTAETTALVNFFTQIPEVMGNLGARWAFVTKDYIENGEVTWETIAERADALIKEADNPIHKAAHMLTLEQYADKVGIGDEFRDSMVRKGEMAISDGIQTLAEIGANNGIFKNKEQGSLILETALIAYPVVKGGKNFISRKYNERYTTVEYIDPQTGKTKRQRVRVYQNGRAENIVDGSPLDNVIQANPKAGGELALTAIVDPTNNIATKLNNKKFNIIHDTLLNQADNFTSDIKNTPSLEHKLKTLTEDFSALFTENYFNPLQNYEVRKQYADLLQAVVSESQGKLHLNKSKFTLAQNNIFGKSRFGKDDSYMIYSRQEAIGIYNKIKQDIIDQGKAFYGDLKNFKENRGNLKLYIEDLDTGKKYTPDTLMKESKFFNLQDFKERKGKDVLDANDMAEFKNNLEGSERTLSVTLEFDRAFDPLDLHIYDSNGLAPKTTYFGSEGIAKAADVFSNNILSLGAQFDNWLSQGYQRAAEKTNYNTRAIVNEINKIATSPHSSYVFETLNHLFINGLKDISRADLVKLHRPLFDQIDASKRTKLIDSVYTDIQTVKLITKLDYAYTNKLFKEDLVANGFKEALYNKGNLDTMLQPIKTEFPFIKEDIGLVWDFEAKAGTDLVFDKVKDGIPYDKYGRQIVQLRFPQQDPFDLNKRIDVYEYGVIDSAKFQIDSLPTQVLDKVPGYLPTVHKAVYFIEIEPNSLFVNGKFKQQPEVLSQYRQVVGTADTIKDAKAFAKKMEADLPMDADGQPAYRVVEPRRAENTYNDIKTDQEIYRASAASAKTRGEYLSRNFKNNNLEDMMVSLAKSHRALDRLNLLDPHLRVFEEYFVRTYPEFLKRDRQGEPIFPRSQSDIINPNINREKYRAALNKYKYYESQQTYLTQGEGLVNEFVNKVYDGFEWMSPNFINKRANPILRKLDGQQITSLGNKIASGLYIALNTLRQPFVQTTQIVGWLGGNPHTALRDTSMSVLVNLRLLAEADKFKGTPAGEGIKQMVHSILKVTDVPGFRIMQVPEFEAWIDAVNKSGLAQSASLNMMVNELLGDKYNPINPSKMQQAVSAVTSPVRGVVGVARTVGFNFAEFQNRLFFANIAMMNKRKLAGKDLNLKDKRTQDDIFYEGWRLSGSQTRQGAFNFQKGLTSSLFQFLAAVQKIANTIFQNNATNLTAASRARWFAGQTIMYGSAGFIFGKFLVDMLDKQHPEDQLDENTRALIERGLANYLVNELFYQAVQGGEGKRPNIDYSTSVAPMGESGTPFAFIEFIYNIQDIFTEKGGTFRIPAIQGSQSLLKAFDTFDFFMRTKDITKEEMTSALPRVFEFVSGMSNITKSYIQAESGEIVTSFGNSISLQKTQAELAAQMFGFRTVNENELYAILRDENKRNERNKKVAEDVYKQMVKIFNSPDVKSSATPLETVTNKMKVIGETLTVLEQGGKFFSKDDILAIQKQIIAFDRRAAKGDIESSILGRLFRSQERETNEFINNVINKLERIDKPSTKKAVEMLKERFNIKQTDTKQEDVSVGPITIEGEQ